MTLTETRTRSEKGEILAFQRSRRQMLHYFRRFALDRNGTRGRGSGRRRATERGRARARGSRVADMEAEVASGSDKKIQYFQKPIGGAVVDAEAEAVEAAKKSLLPDTLRERS